MKPVSEFSQEMLVEAIQNALHNARNIPMGERGLRFVMGRLNEFRTALRRIDPEHPLAKDLPRPFFSLSAYKIIPHDWKDWADEYRQSKKPETAKRKARHRIGVLPSVQRKRKS